jgi:hypothetical protein
MLSVPIAIKPMFAKVAEWIAAFARMQRHSALAAFQLYGMRLMLFHLFTARMYW